MRRFIAGAGVPTLTGSPDLGGDGLVYNTAFFLGDGGKETVTVHAGEVLHIPSNVPHEAHAVEDTLDVDVFSPPRQDWLNKTDSYLRK